jgi:hypothetical protein
LFAITISAVQLLPTAEYFLNSQRAGEYGYEIAMTYSFWPWRFLSFLMPGLFGSPATGNYWGYGNYWEDAIYIGLFPFLLGTFFLGKSILRIGKREKDTNVKGLFIFAIFLGAISVLSFLLALGDNTAIFPFLYRFVPSFDLFQGPTRYSLIAEISLALLAGIGAGFITKPTGKRLYLTRLAIAGCVSIVAAAVLAWVVMPDIRATFIVAAGRAGTLGLLIGIAKLTIPDKKDEQKGNVWKLLVICLISLDLISAGWGLNPGIETEFYQVTESRVELGRIWMPEEVEYRLKFDTFFDFEDFSIENDWNEMHRVNLPNLTMLQRAEIVNNFDPMVPSNYQAWMDWINDDFPSENILEIMNINSIMMFSETNLAELIPINQLNQEARVAGCAKTVSTNEHDLDSVFTKEIHSENLAIFTDKQVSCEPNTSGDVEIVERKNGYLRLNVNLNQDGWIFWSQTWYPGWIYRIDGGKGDPTYRMNYLFQGAQVPMSANQVEFLYRPVLFYWGSGLSGASLIAGIVFLAFRKKQRRNH